MTPSPTPLERKMEERINKILKRLPSGDDVVDDGHATANIIAIFQDEVKELVEVLEAVNSLANKEGEQPGFSLKAQRIIQSALSKWKTNSYLKKEMEK